MCLQLTKNQKPVPLIPGEDTFGCVEEIRTGNDSLAFKTAYKKRKQVESSDELLPDGHPKTSITTPDKSNNVSTDKGTKNNSNPQAVKALKVYVFTTLIGGNGGFLF